MATSLSAASKTTGNASTAIGAAATATRAADGFVALTAVGTSNEEQLRSQLRSAISSLKRKEPLEPTYKRLLMSGAVTSRRPVLPKDKFYKRIGSQLRDRVDCFLQQTEGKDPFDRIFQRQPLEDVAMRAALTLREAKEHEQLPLLEATLAALPRKHGMDWMARKRYFEGIALGLQSKETPTIILPTSNTAGAAGRGRSPLLHASGTAMIASSADKDDLLVAAASDLDRQKAQARAREAARRKRDEDDRKQKEDEIERNKRKRIETPQQSLQKIYQPIFKKLWDMEFPNLGGINPFRIVIDRENCASVGAPDYFDVIEKPMNLTYIQQKVENLEYDTLSSFFADVELMISNALLYNSDPHNPYRAAAEDMKKRYMKLRKKVLQTLQSRQQQQQAQRK